MTPLWFVLVVTISLNVGYANANCSFLQSSLLAQHPLFLDNNAYTDVRRFRRVETTGYMNMVAGENVTLVCTGKHNFMTGFGKAVDVTTASCISSYNFRIDGQTVDIRKVACFYESSVDLQFRAINTCGPNTAVIDVGFTLPVYPYSFLKLYELCWDASTLSTISSQHLVISGYRPSKSGTRSSYLYREIDPNQAYVVNTQTQSFTTQLDSDSAKKYITSAHYLAYRTMVPYSDFVYGHQQLSVYFYFNSVPLWRNWVTNTYWNTLETSIRTLANTEGNLNVYQGALGILELPNSAGELKPIYLYANGNQRYMSVPAYMVKSVTNSVNEQVVFVQIVHRGEITRTQVTERVCAEDVCAQLRWLPWRHVPPAERPLVTCCRADDALLRRRLPRALAMDSAPSAGLLVGRAEHYD